MLKKQELTIKAEDDIDLHELTESIAALSQPLLKPGVSMRNRCQAGRTKFKGDLNRLGQVIQNLASATLLPPPLQNSN